MSTPAPVILHFTGRDGEPMIARFDHPLAPALQAHAAQTIREWEEGGRQGLLKLPLASWVGRAAEHEEPQL